MGYGHWLMVGSVHSLHIAHQNISPYSSGSKVTVAVEERTPQVVTIPHEEVRLSYAKEDCVSITSVDLSNSSALGTMTPPDDPSCK